MGYEVPTYEELRDAALDDLALQIDGVDRTVHSDNYARASVLAALGEGEYAYLQFLSRQVSPYYATEEFLDRWLQVYGLERFAASTATGTCTATGTAGSTIPTSTLLTSAGGQSYLVTVEAEIPEAGEVELSVESQETGLNQNLDAGEDLTFDSAPAGVDATAEVVAVDGGRDRETDDEARVRLLLRTQHTPGGGNATDWERWALEVSGISSVVVMPLRRGLGTVDVLPLGPEGNKLISEALRLAVADYLEELRPVCCDLEVVVPAENEVDVAIEVLPAEGYEFDWEGTKTVAAGATTEVIPLDSVDGLEEGDRIVIGLEQREINSIDEGTPSVTVAEALSEAPAETTTVYPGGPLWEPIRDAIIAYFHALEPLQTLYVNALQAEAALEGVLNQTLTDPAADQELVDALPGGPPIHVLGDLVITEAAA